MSLQPQADPGRIIATGNVEQVNRAVESILQSAERAGPLSEDRQRDQVRYSVVIGLRVGGDRSFDASNWDAFSSAVLDQVAGRGRFESEALREVMRHVAGKESWQAPFSYLTFTPSPQLVLDMVENLLTQDGFLREGDRPTPFMGEHDEAVLAAGLELFVTSPDPAVAQWARRLLHLCGRQDQLAD